MPGVKNIAGCCCDECCLALPSEYRIRRDTADGWWQAGDSIELTMTGCEGWEAECTLNFVATGVGTPINVIFESAGDCGFYVSLIIFYIETDEDTDEFVFGIAEFIVCPDPLENGDCEDAECQMVRNQITKCLEILPGPAATEETVCEPCCPVVTLTVGEASGGAANWWCVEDPETGCRICTYSEDGTEPEGAIAGPFPTPVACAAAMCGRYYCVEESCVFLNCPPGGQTFEDGWDTLEECQAADCEPPPPETCWYCVLVGEEYVCLSQFCTDPPPGGAQGGSHPTSTACEAICSLWQGPGCYCVGPLGCCMYLSSPDDLIPFGGSIESGKHGDGPECEDCEFHCPACE